MSSTAKSIADAQVRAAAKNATKPLTIVKMTGAKHIPQLHGFLKAYRLENEKIGNNQERNIFFPIEEVQPFFDMFEENNLDCPIVQYYLTHAITGIYLIFDDPQKDPIGINMLTEIQDDGYVEPHIVLLPNKTNEGYGTKVFQQMWQQLQPYIDTPVLSADHKPVNFQGLYGWVDVRNIPSLILQVKLGLTPYDYRHVIDSGTVIHCVCFSYPKIRMQQPLMSGDVEMPVQEKKQMLTRIEKHLRDSVERDKREKSLGEFRTATLPLFERHKKDFNDYVACYRKEVQENLEPLLTAQSKRNEKESQSCVELIQSYLQPSFPVACNFRAL